MAWYTDATLPGSSPTQHFGSAYGARAVTANAALPATESTANPIIARAFLLLANPLETS